jgi:hypothetical protein
LRPGRWGTPLLLSDFRLVHWRILWFLSCRTWSLLLRSPPSKCLGGRYVRLFCALHSTWW